jgi:hypothetical protein
LAQAFLGRVTTAVRVAVWIKTHALLAAVEAVRAQSVQMRQTALAETVVRALPQALPALRLRAPLAAVAVALALVERVALAVAAMVVAEILTAGALPRTQVLVAAVLLGRRAVREHPLVAPVQAVSSSSAATLRRHRPQVLRSPRRAVVVSSTSSVPAAA